MLIARRRSGKGVVVLSVACRGNAFFRLPNDAKVVTKAALADPTMTDLENKALLPAGLRDILPPEAAFEAGIREMLAGTYASHGYDRVKPPLVEFEEGLTSGAGEAVSCRYFPPDGSRLAENDGCAGRHDDTGRADSCDPSWRIAAALRLSYTGEVLRMRGTQLRPERQFAQVGAELIGTASAAADIEIIAIAVESLRAIGVPGLSVDLTIPPLVPALMDNMDLSEEDYRALRDAVDRKDVGAVRESGQNLADELSRLMAGTGTADHALDVLSGLSLPSAPAGELDRLKAVVEGLGQRIPALDITVDPVENRGFEYHTGIGFTFFARGERGEIGAGGRYVILPNGNEDENGEGNRQLASLCSSIPFCGLFQRPISRRVYSCRLGRMTMRWRRCAMTAG